MKKILFSIIFIFLIFAQSIACADEKITSVNYDTAGNMLFMASNTEQPISKDIKIVKLSNPNRVYFDINDAILTTEAQNYQISSNMIRQVVVSQNSNSPNVVRVVLYFNEAYKTSNLRVLRLNNNIIVTFNNDICSQANYMNTTYRDEKYEKSDYYSFISMQSQNITAVEKPLSANGSEKVLSQIQMAFDNSTVPVNIKSSYQNANVNVQKKSFKLKSKYYLTGLQAKTNGVLVSGFGNVSLEKIIKLSSPGRAVFDLPNTVSDSSVRSKLYKYGLDSIRIGQFEANKTRIVITSENPDKYLPIYSTDNQSVLLADKENLNHTMLSGISTNLVNTRITKVDDENYGVNFYFSKPVVYSVKRENTHLTIYFFNAVQYNDQDFRLTMKASDFSNPKIDLMPKIGLRFTTTLEDKDIVKVFAGADSRTIKLQMKVPKKQNPVKKVTETISALPTVVPDKIIKRKSGDKVVVIDPGHGGVDYGAIRAGINEKDITTDVSNRVTAILKSKGYKVYMTRSEDKTVSLQDRVDYTENVAPDIFVSIHVNSSQGTEATGIETHYYHEYSIPLAKSVHGSMAANINSRDRGLLKSRFYVINHTTMPAILVEIGFISNEKERNELISEKRKQTTAKAIADGIIKYYKEQK